MLFACKRENKWKDAKKIEFTRRESYNYSEMLSGDLDSTEKSELEKYKEYTKKKNINSKKIPLQQRMSEAASNTLHKAKQIFNYFKKTNISDSTHSNINK